METEVDVQSVVSCCFAASSPRTQSAVLWSGGDCNILASTDLALHTALTFSSGTPANADGVNVDSNTANNTRVRFIRTLHSMRLEPENLLAGIAVPAL